MILEEFLQLEGHVTSEQLYQSVREHHPNIGYTTVYRTMKLLADAGLAQERHFDDGVMSANSHKRTLRALGGRRPPDRKQTPEIRSGYSFSQPRRKGA